jgi:hypothetical protein
MPRKLLLAVSLAALTLAAPAAAYDSEPFVGRGVIRAVRWIEEIVLLENEQGFEILNLDQDATIQDSKGIAIALLDLSLGSAVEYTGRYWEGLNFVRALRVVPAALVIGAQSTGEPKAMKRVTDIIGEIASASQEQGAGIDPARSTKPIDQRSAVAHDAALLEEF